MTMELICLNTWGGRAGKEKLLAFFEKHKDADIFCLQEIWSSPHKEFEGRLVANEPFDYSKVMTYGLQEISAMLSDFIPIFRPLLTDNYGLLMFVRNTYSVLSEGEFYVYRERGYISENDIADHARAIQYVTMETDKGQITVINFHGLWNGGGKEDCADRLEQSDKILNFVRKLENPYIICGDFNLLPHTESLKKFEKYGLRNLIKEYSITSTRTSFYTKPEKHADYVFVSEGIKVKDFKVFPDEVSDHAPLYLEFE